MGKHIASPWQNEILWIMSQLDMDAIRGVLSHGWLQLSIQQSRAPISQHCEGPHQGIGEQISIRPSAQIQGG